MNNPFQQLQERASGSLMAQGLSQAAGLMQAMQNPVAALFGQAMQNSDPRLQEVFKYAQQYGGDFEAAFYALAKEKGVNPEDVLNQARKQMTNFNMK